MATEQPRFGPKELIAITDGTAIEAFAPRTMTVGQAFGAHVSIWLAAPRPAASDYAPNVDAAQIDAVALRIEQAAADRLAVLHQAIGAIEAADAHLLIETSACLIEQLVARVRHVDLVLMPDDRGCGNLALRDRLITAILDQAACPVMVMRDRAATWPARRAVLAWNGSRACSRAWRDARPLLQPGADVAIATGGPSAADAPLIEPYVARHGFKAHVHYVSIHPMHEERRSPSERLVEFEREIQPDLLVMGAGRRGDELSPLTRAMVRDGQTALLLSR